MPAKYKSTFRSLLPEIKSLLKMASRNNWNDGVLTRNIATVVVWRIMDRDRKLTDQIRRLRRAVNDLT